MMLDPNKAVPLYEQLRNLLQERLDTQQIQPGDRLPTEAELCAKYSVSRITVRRAIDELVESGYLERKQGKGTFAAMKRVEVFAHPLSSVTVGFTRSGGTEEERTTRVVSKKEYAANKHECDVLGIEDGQSVYIFNRQMFVNGKAWGLDRAVYPAKQYPGFFEKVRDNVSTYSVLKSDYGVNMKRTHKELSFALATSEQAKLLDCTVGAPLFRTYKVVYDDRNRPVHFSTTYIKADQVVFSSDNVLQESVRMPDVQSAD